MITKFKIFEQIKTRNIGETPQIGDYAIIDHEWFNFLHIGKEPNIVKIVNITPLGSKGLVTFENGIMNYGILKIKYWSRYKDDLEDLIMSKKYNL